MTTLRRPPANTPALYEQDGKGYNATVHAHYFVAGNDWLVTEYDPTQDLAFGWACLNGDRQNAELGYVDFKELESVKVPGLIAGMRIGFPVEYDEGWQPRTLTEAIAELDRRQGR